MKIVHTKQIPTTTAGLMFSWCNTQVGYGGFKNAWFAWEEIAEIKWVAETEGRTFKFTFRDNNVATMFTLKFSECII